MPKHLGWRKNDFFIGHVKIAEARITRRKTRIGYRWTVTIKKHERSTDGNIIRTTKKVERFDNKVQATKFLQIEKSRISEDFRMWRIIYH